MEVNVFTSANLSNAYKYQYRPASLAIDLSTFSYYVDGEVVPSIQFVTYMLSGAGFNDQTAPWGTKWMGKGAKGGALYNNL